MKTIAERLKFARELKGWTQAQLAIAAGVSTGTIGNIESGARQSKGSLPQIAEALWVNHKWLATGQGVHGFNLGEKIPPNSAIYEPNMPVARMDSAWAATALIANLRNALRETDDKELVAYMLTTLIKDPENERVAQALHLMLDTAFAQAGKRAA